MFKSIEPDLQYNSDDVFPFSFNIFDWSLSTNSKHSGLLSSHYISLDYKMRNWKISSWCQDSSLHHRININNSPGQASRNTGWNMDKLINKISSHHWSLVMQHLNYQLSSCSKGCLNQVLLVDQSTSPGVTRNHLVSSYVDRSALTIIKHFNSRRWIIIELLQERVTQRQHQRCQDLGHYSDCFLCLLVSFLSHLHSLFCRQGMELI